MAIYKVKSNVFNEKIGEIFYKLSKDYSLLFVDEQLFISPNRYNQEINFKKALKPKKDFLISEIDVNEVVKNFGELTLEFSAYREVD